MKIKLYDLYRKYRMAILIVLCIIILGIIIIFLLTDKNNVTIKEFKNDYYSFKYDSSWKLEDNKDSYVKLKHNEDSYLEINIVDLVEEYKYAKIDEILDSFIYEIGNQNASYNLLSKQKNNITKNNYEGYKLLYEYDDSEVMVVIAKKNSNLLVFTFKSSIDFFDILLDSVQSIIYEFTILDKEFNLSYKIDLNTSNISWEDNDELANINEKNTYEIANNNYLVTYSIPEYFILSSFDSTMGLFNYKGLNKGSLSLSVSIRNLNIYEYVVNDGNSSSLYNSYNTIREGKNRYSNFVENIEEVRNSTSKKYIYKNSYLVENSYSNTPTKYEETIIVQELDSSHIIIFTLRSMDNKIPKDLVSSISVESSKNYANYIQRKIVDNYLIGELKEYVDYSKDKVRHIVLKLPTKYEELDKKNNIYDRRNYGLNYNEELERYQYNIEYSKGHSTELKINSIISSLSYYSKRDNYKILAYSNDININDKTIKVYNGGYTEYSNVTNDYFYVNVKVLIIELENSVLAIEIKGNGFNIDNKMIEELVNFDIEIK